MRRARGSLRVDRKSNGDPTFMDFLIVIGLTLVAIGIALGLYVWIPLAIIAWFIAGALGYSGWLGVGIVAVLFLLKWVF